MLTRVEALERLRCMSDVVEPDQSYVVERARPEDAEGIAKLFHIVYGESYPVDAYYDPDAIRSLQQAGGLHSVVARLETGQIVGHSGLYRASAPFAGLLEFGLGMIHPAYRGSFILFHLSNVILTGPAQEVHVRAIYGEPVCDTVITQHLSSLYGLRPSAFEVDVLPGTGAGRVSCFIMTKESHASRRRVYIPAVYAEQVAFLYSCAERDRELCVATDEPGAGPTRAATALYAQARVARGNLMSAGADWAEYLRRSDADALGQGCRVLQWFVSLGEPHAGWAVQCLREQGYFLGGIVPRWFDDDGLFMQKVLDPPGWDRALLYGETARQIVELVRADFAGAAMREGR